MVTLKRIIIVLSLIVPGSASFYADAQCERNVEKFYGKVIALDTINKIMEGRDFRDHGNNFYYGIYHVLIQTHTSDTVTLGIIYSLREQRAELRRSFNILKDSTYTFSAARITPCQSDFPNIKGCEFDEKESACQYNPFKGQVVKKPYKTILRFIEKTVLYPEVWERLYEEYKKRNN